MFPIAAWWTISVSTQVSILQSSSKNKRISTKITTVLVVLADKVFEIFDSSGTLKSPSSSDKSSLSTSSRFSSSSESEVTLSSPFLES